MPDFTVIQHGTDPNGRPIYMTRYMAEWWERVTDELGFDPTIVQGAFMARAGGGAAASAGYHDLAGCLDLRVWDRSEEQVQRMIRVLRQMGAAAWLRDERHGMDDHIHLVLGTDHPLTVGASYQWRQYVRGRDGLAGDGPDYHGRPSPLVLEPPEEDPMADYEGQLKRIEKKLNDVDTRLKRVQEIVNERNKRIREILRAEFNASDKQLDAIVRKLEG